MNSNLELSEIILKKATDNTLKKSEKLYYIEKFIAWHLNDCFKLIKNINETSLNSIDKAQRLIQIEKEYGIPKTHLL
jgi:uncharacterized pyridoxamine 5'-phosphate oxidase family protein